ncbi:MFS transporter [Intrasporangium chromatireducens]|uniref:MFS transporter n=1 Tax=Intrasporangium chromatireducens TaxID=1386088 RepID=UPI0023E40F8A|nr:MFS transporter [Intrasporangium chromatireducens]
MGTAGEQRRPPGTRRPVCKERTRRGPVLSRRGGGLPFGWFPCIVAASLVSHAVLSGVRTLMSYRALALGGDALTVGVVTAAFAVLPLLVAIQIGRAVDRGRGVAALRLGLGLSAAAVLLAALSPSVLVLSAASALLGLGQMLHTVACQSLIPMWSPEETLDSRFAHLTLGVSTGQLLGFPIAGAVATAAGVDAAGHAVTTPALLVLAALSAVAIPLAYTFAARSNEHVSRAEHAERRQTATQILGTRGMKPAIYSSLAVLTGMDLVMAYLPVLGQEIGLSIGTVTALLTARTVTSVASRALMPWLLRHVARRWLLVSATGVSALAILALPMTSNVPVLTLAMLVAGFFWGIGQPLTMTWVTQVADANNRSAALSVRLAGNRLGQVLVPLAAGSLAAALGVGSIFVGCGLVLLSSATTTYNATRPDVRPGAAETSSA